MLSKLRRYLILCFFIVPSLSYADFIVHTSLSLKSLTVYEMVQLFSFFSPYTSAGEKVVIILPPKDSLSFKVLAMRYLKTQPIDYYESIQSKIYSGKANPIFTDTDDYVLIKVAVTPFSIGFHHDQIILNTDYGIRVLNITR
jgi:hypothetical protein